MHMNHALNMEILGIRNRCFVGFLTGPSKIHVILACIIWITHNMMIMQVFVFFQILCVSQQRPEPTRYATIVLMTVGLYLSQTASNGESSTLTYYLTRHLQCTRY